MAESPDVLEARERLIALVPDAVRTLGDLMANSEQDNVRLGASREVLDRGGLPAKTTHTVEIEVGLDAEIEQLLRGIKRQSVRNTGGDDLDNIEDAIVIEDQPALLGEAVVTEREEERAAALKLESKDEPTENEDDAWWQAASAEEPPL